MAEIIEFPSKMVIDASIALAFLLPDERETKENISFYDASYLALAKKEKIPLLSLDRLLPK